MVEAIVFVIGFISMWVFLRYTCNDRKITPGMVYKHIDSGTFVRVTKSSYGWIYYFINNSTTEYCMDEDKFIKVFTNL